MRLATWILSLTMLVRAEQHSLSAASDASGEEGPCSITRMVSRVSKTSPALSPAPPTSSTTISAWRPGCAGKHNVVGFASDARVQVHVSRLYVNLQGAKTEGNATNKTKFEMPKCKVDGGNETMQDTAATSADASPSPSPASPSPSPESDVSDTTLPRGLVLCSRKSHSVLCQSTDKIPQPIQDILEKVRSGGRPWPRTSRKRSWPLEWYSSPRLNFKA